MATQVQFRGGTTSEHSSFNGAAREVTVDTTKQTLVVQDGSTNGGFPLLGEKNADDIKLILGTHDDLEIFHGSNISTIKDGKGDLRIMGDTIRIQRNAGGENFLYATEGGKTSLYHDGNENFETTATGVKITSSGSSHGLYIYKGSNIAAFLGHIGTGDEGQLSLKNGGTDTIILNGETGAGTFNGNVTITNTQPKLFLTDTNNTSDFSIQNENGNLSFYDETNTANRFKIISTGQAYLYSDLYINSATPRIYLLDSNSNSDYSIINNNGNFGVYDDTNSAFRLYIDSNGSVGIGTDTPSNYYAEKLVVTAGAEEGVTINRDANSGTNYLMFAEGTSGEARYRGWVGYTHNATSADGVLTLAANGSTRAVVKGNGDLSISDGNLVIATGGHGIDFSAQTWTATGNTINSTDGNPEVLDHYEEGTWTPTDASGAGMSFNVTGAVYTRIGRMVYARAHQINFPTTSNTTGAYIGGLPFSCGGSHGSGARGVISNSYAYAQLVDNNSSKFWMYGATTTSGSTYQNLSGAVIYGLCLIYEIST